MTEQLMKRGLGTMKWAALAVIVCAGAMLRAAETDRAKALAAARELERAYVETIKNALPAYVFFPGGSGVMISADGYMLTNNHVIREKKRVSIRNNGKRYSAKVI